MVKGKVYLVGAGPGDPGLITVKGRDCISMADVIIYDRLVHPGLLAYRRAEAEVIYAGKSPERHTLTQDQINNLLVEKAGAGKIVTRLKGGDPFVFGRGGEEAEMLAKKNIPFEIVPGVSSATAVPAYAGIPVTHRDYASSLAIVTGNEDPDKENSSINWRSIAAIETVVMLMGVGNLDKIASKLVEHGRSPQTPVALIQWGTRPEQRTITGQLANIADQAQKANITNPAVIVVGEVVKLRDQLAWLEKKPLFGKRIIVTRAREQASVFARRIALLGGEPIEFPTIKIVPPDDFEPLDDAIASIEQFDWIVFTSVNGVKFFLQRLTALDRDIRDLKGANLCAIGPKTEMSLRQLGLKVEYIPTEYRAEEIARGLRGRIKPGDRVLLPRADIARKALPRLLQEMGANAHEVPAYKTVTDNRHAGVIIDMLRRNQIDVVTFTSSSTVRNFVQLLNQPDLSQLMQNVTVACIGPITAETAAKEGLKVSIVAEEYTIEGLLQAILSHYDA